MTAPKPVKNITKAEPTLSSLLDEFKKDIMLSINCHAIATVQEVDYENQTLKATINYKKTFFKKQSNNSYEPILVDYPVLIDMPFISLGGGAFSQRFPVKPDDTCLVMFNDRNIDSWFDSGQVTEVPTARLHSLSDGIALVGVRSLANKLEDYDSENYQVTNGDVLFQLGSNNKVKLENSSKNLNTLLQSLIDEIKNITFDYVGAGNGSSLQETAGPKNSSALTSIASEIEELLE